MAVIIDSRSQREEYYEGTKLDGPIYDSTSDETDGAAALATTGGVGPTASFGFSIRR